MNEVCPNKNRDSIEFGCYKQTSNKIYILKVEDEYYKEIQYTIAGHEMLHAAYVKQNNSDKAKINNKLNEIYESKIKNEYQNISGALETYDKNDKESINDELHSYIGTLANDQTIGNSLVSYYSKFFSNRNVQIKSEVSFNTKLDNQKTSLDIQLKDLDSKKQELLDYKAEWLDKIKRYLDRNEYYGDYYTYNKNVDAYNNNLTNYNKMVNEYETARIDYNSDVNKFNSLMASFRPSIKGLKEEYK